MKKKKKQQRRTFVEIGFTQTEIKLLKEESVRRSVHITDLIGDTAIENLSSKKIRNKQPLLKPPTARYPDFHCDDPEDMCAGERLANGFR